MPKVLLSKTSHRNTNAFQVPALSENENKIIKEGSFFCDRLSSEWYTQRQRCTECKHLVTPSKDCLVYCRDHNFKAGGGYFLRELMQIQPCSPGFYRILRRSTFVLRRVIY